jgi:lipooligosaccharide transport system permease protein
MATTEAARPSTPGAPGASGGVGSVLAYQLRVARRYWRSVVIGGLATPLFYVLSLGVGLGTVVDRHQGGTQLGVSYLVFVAPAFLTAAALQIGASDASYPVLGGFKWERTFHGMGVTPLSSRQICDGVLLWIAVRLLVNSAVYLAIMAAFGGTTTWWVLLCIPIAALTAMGFAALVAALAASVYSEVNPFNLVARFVVVPMFLFSGTFFPISQLPAWGQWLARLTPLWHGTQLARDAALGGGLPTGSVLGHLAYLVVLLVVGVGLARWRFRIRIERGAS